MGGALFARFGGEVHAVAMIISSASRCFPSQSQVYIALARKVFEHGIGLFAHEARRCLGNHKMLYNDNEIEKFNLK